MGCYLTPQGSNVAGCPLTACFKPAQMVQLKSAMLLLLGISGWTTFTPGALRKGGVACTALCYGRGAGLPAVLLPGNLSLGGTSTTQVFPVVVSLHGYLCQVLGEVCRAGCTARLTAAGEGAVVAGLSYFNACLSQGCCVSG